jgi:DNA-binding NtrC family response regulator
VRVVCATRRDILKEVNNETFRSDLYFRVAQARLELPALRERVGDIPALAEHLFVEAGAREAFARLTAESLDRAAHYDWPGNVRELRNVIGLAVAYDTGDAIELGPHMSRSEMPTRGRMSRIAGGTTVRTFAEAKLELEETYFRELHIECAGNVSEMARRSGVDRKTVRESLRRHGLAG